MSTPERSPEAFGEELAALLDALAALPGPILVALSGGVDSSFLLRALREVRSDLRALHVQHHLRAEAHLDEAGARALCGALGVPLEVVHLDPERLRCAPVGLEAAARAARYRVLASRARGEVIVTGHTGTDHLETVLMRLIQGTGLIALGGPLPLRAAGTREGASGPRVARPLLGWRKAWVEEGARRWALRPVEDASNRDDRHLRNRVRPVAEALEELAPAAALGRSLRLVRQDARALELLLRSTLAEHVERRLCGTIEVNREVLAGAPQPLRAAMLAALLRWLPARPSEGVIERVGALLARGGEGRIRGAGFDVVVGRRHVRLQRGGAVQAQASLPFSPLPRVPIPGATGRGAALLGPWHVHWEVAFVDGPAAEPSGSACLAAEGGDATGERAGRAGPLLRGALTLWARGGEMELRAVDGEAIWPTSRSGMRVGVRLAKDGWRELERGLAIGLYEGAALLAVIGGRVAGGSPIPPRAERAARVSLRWEARPPGGAVWEEGA